MRKGLLPGLAVCWLLNPATAVAQADSTPEPVYMEPASRGMTRFFFDDQYYLTDKHCTFKQIERLAWYKVAEQAFEGDFTDFGSNGKPVLEGTYTNGRKNGTFKAYHSTGKLKWTARFEEDMPRDVWKYYYPDGRPLMEVNFENNRPSLLNMWDQRGRQRVKDGKGRYSFTIPSGTFNEYGHEAVTFSGRIQEGVPHGYWLIEYHFADGKKEPAAYEQYEHGVMTRGFDNYTGRFYREPRFSLLLPEHFTRAEELTGKACTIDDYLGYTEFLRKRLEDAFILYDATALLPQEIEFRVHVNRTGEPQKVETVQTLPEPKAASVLLTAIESVEYWLPSYADDEYIADMLTVTAHIFPSLTTGHLEFYSVRITRENGR